MQFESICHGRLIDAMRGKKLRELPSVVHEDNEYKPGDCVLINPDAEAPAYVRQCNRNN